MKYPQRLNTRGSAREVPQLTESTFAHFIPPRRPLLHPRGQSSHSRPNCSSPLRSRIQLHIAHSLNKSISLAEPRKHSRRMSNFMLSLSLTCLRSPSRSPTKVHSQLSTVNDLVLQERLRRFSRCDIDKVRMRKSSGLTRAAVDGDSHVENVSNFTEKIYQSHERVSIQHDPIKHREFGSYHSSPDHSSRNSCSR